MSLIDWSVGILICCGLWKRKGLFFHQLFPWEISKVIKSWPRLQIQYTAKWNLLTLPENKNEADLPEPIRFPSVCLVTINSNCSNVFGGVESLNVHTKLLCKSKLIAYMNLLHTNSTNMMFQNNSLLDT